MALSWRMHEKARVTKWPTGPARGGHELPKYYFRPCSHLSLFRASMATSLPGFSFLLQPWLQLVTRLPKSGRQNWIREGNKSKYLSLWQELLYGSPKWVCHLVYYRLMTRVFGNINNTLKIVLQKCKRQNPGNGFCYSLGISCTGRLIYQSGK